MKRKDVFSRLKLKRKRVSYDSNIFNLEIHRRKNLILSQSNKKLEADQNERNRALCRGQQHCLA